MPTYDYLCADCGHEFEHFQSMRDDPLTDCPACDTGKVRRKIGLGAGIIFKGSGFYETDFKDRRGNKGPEGGESTQGADKNASPKAEKAPAPPPSSPATVSSST